MHSRIQHTTHTRHSYTHTHATPLTHTTHTHHSHTPHTHHSHTPLTHTQVYGYDRADGVGRASDLVIQGFIRFITMAAIPVVICAGVLYVLVSE